MRTLTRHCSTRLLLAVCAMTSYGSPAAAQSHDGSYAGQITCERIPGQTAGRLKTDFILIVAGGKARYEREVMQRTDTTRGTGVFERGTGTVPTIGEVILTGGAGRAHWRDDASYRGQLAGMTSQLSGTQLWRLPDRDPHTRPCSISLVKGE